MFVTISSIACSGTPCESPEFLSEPRRTDGVEKKVDRRVGVEEDIDDGPVEIQ